MKIIFLLIIIGVLLLDHHWDLADQMARDNGYPDEVTPLLCALIKSRNGRLDEAQKFLDEGKNICENFLKSEIIFLLF